MGSPYRGLLGLAWNCAGRGKTDIGLSLKDLIGTTIDGVSMIATLQVTRPMAKSLKIDLI
jgi:hypothetical protein